MQTRPLSQCGAVMVVPEMMLHLIPAHLDAVRAGSLEQKALSMHPGLEIHFQPVVERGGVSRKPAFEGFRSYRRGVDSVLLLLAAEAQNAFRSTPCPEDAQAVGGDTRLFCVLVPGQWKGSRRCFPPEDPLPAADIAVRGGATTRDGGGSIDSYSQVCICNILCLIRRLPICETGESGGGVCIQCPGSA